MAKVENYYLSILGSKNKNSAFVLVKYRMVFTSLLTNKFLKCIT